MNADRFSECLHRTLKVTETMDLSRKSLPVFFDNAMGIRRRQMRSVRP